MFTFSSTSGSLITHCRSTASCDCSCPRIDRNFDRAIMAERAHVNAVNCITLAAAHRRRIAVNTVADNKKCRALERSRRDSRAHVN